MSDPPQLLLAHHLKALKLPTFLREYDKLAQQCAAEGVGSERLTGALLDRLTHHVHILEMKRRQLSPQAEQAATAAGVTRPAVSLPRCRCGEGPVLAMLALLRVVPLLPSPTLRAAANGPQVGTGKQAQAIELESRVHRGAAWPRP